MLHRNQPGPAAIKQELTLVLGGTGKTGRRIADRLTLRGAPIRIAARSTTPNFDWNDPATWGAALEGATAIYLNYAPDLAIPGAAEAIEAFTAQAARSGVRRLVLLSGRGEEEAQHCEAIVQRSGLDWTIVRASWFNQNFSEGAFFDMVAAGAITLPAGNIGEPFVDANDIADVAAAALTEHGHAGQIYEVTGPRLLTFADAAAEIARASGREIKFIEIPHEAFAAELSKSGAPGEIQWLLNYLFSTVLDGRNAAIGDGVERALGRQPIDFSDYARRIAGRAGWKAAA